MTDGRLINVVVSRLIRKNQKNEEVYSDWGLFVSTDLSLTSEEIIQLYSRRFNIEEMFKELKETCGLGRQQTRKFESSLIVMLSYIYGELLTWNASHEELVPYGTRRREDLPIKTKGIIAVRDFYRIS